MKLARLVLLSVTAQAAGLLTASAHAGAQYFVDPVAGVDAPDRGTQAAPWRTTAYAVDRIDDLPPASQAGLVLNLKAGSLYPLLALTKNLRGTPEQPIVIQPYGGNRVVFDAGEPRFRQPGAWEPVPDRPGEWRSIDRFPLSPDFRIAWGQLMDRKLRLVTYNRLEDLRASNESYQRVPLSDPRPGIPIPGDEGYKLPFTYIGPGVYFVYDDPQQTVGRVHLRLSPTEMKVPGIEDYPGALDPNSMNLSLSGADSFAAGISAQNVVLRRLTFQNGGLRTLRIHADARNITFDHCEVYGGRTGVRMAGGSSGIRFHHCLFDGGLAPWTTRTDVKDSLGSETSDLLVAHAASQSEYVNCTFRRGHDALQIVGDQIEVRDSLFEDMNDEVFQYEAAVSDVRIHGNVIRQALGVNSFHTDPVGGPIYFYRNVIDQRVPTRGYRILVPDAPAPYVWRYGSDFKNGATPPFHVYQNTFISSHADDKGSFVSQTFYDDPTAARTYLNNIHLVLNLDLTLSRVPSSTSPARSDGNVWYRHHPAPPLFQQPLFASALGRYFSFAQLWAHFPEWERHSRYADPLLANFTDEYFEYQAPAPHTDFRPAVGGPADGAGVELPADFPDDFESSSGPPDVGARPVDAPVMAVGVDGAARYPVLGFPVAQAGPDQLIVDGDGDGFERVALDASASHDPDGAIVSYRWTQAGRPLFTSGVPLATVQLPEGEHYLRLEVVDASGRVDSDAVKVRVRAPWPGENRLACAGFEETPCTGWSSASGGITSVAGDVHSGTRAYRLVQDGTTQRIGQRVPVGPSTYTVSGWVKTQSLATDALLTAHLLDASGAVLASQVFGRWRGNSPYAYFQTTVTAPASAAFVEISGTVDGSGGGRAFFDDLRVRDRNLLENGRFELRARTGQDRPAPGWAFGKGGRVVDDPVLARSGRRTLAFEPYDLSPQPGNDYHFVDQRIVHTPGTGYRVSGWVRTAGLGPAPTYQVQFTDAAGQTLGGIRTVAATTSEGAYRYVSRDFSAADVPAGTVFVGVVCRLSEVAAGSAYFDDLMVEPVP
ncbi:MAG: hypothetical protein ABW221_07370 [Vicinamibacteria bacterium]